MRIRRKIPKFFLSLKIKQFPWNFNKMIKLKKRKWARIKFSKKFLTSKDKTGRALKTRFFQTYKKKTKKLFKRYFAARLTDRQCKKLFRSNSRYRATFKQVLKSEQRLDTLIFRLFFLPDVAIARELIKKNYFLLNGKIAPLPKTIIKVGDLIEPTNTVAWRFLYDHMLNVTSSLKKYFSRLFFKFSFPFVIKRRRFRIREFGKYKDRNLNHITKKIKKRITKRVLFSRYRKVKKTTTSKIKPPKRYLFKNPSSSLKEAVKLKRTKKYILKQIKMNRNLVFVQSATELLRKFKKSKRYALEKQRHQLEIFFKLQKLKAKAKKKKIHLRVNTKQYRKRFVFLRLRLRSKAKKKKKFKLLAKYKRKRKKRITQKLLRTVMKKRYKMRNRKKKKIVYKGVRLKKRKKKIIGELRNMKRTFKSRKKFIRRFISKEMLFTKTIRIKKYKKSKKVSLYKKIRKEPKQQKKDKIFRFLSKKPKMLYLRRISNLFRKEDMTKVQKFFGNKKYRSPITLKPSPDAVVKHTTSTVGRYFQKDVMNRISKTFGAPRAEHTEVIQKKNYKKRSVKKKITKFGFFNLFFKRKRRYFKLSKKRKKKNASTKFSIKSRRNFRKKKLRRFRFIPRQPQNSWQVNRITKKHVLIFRYLKKFNNRYKQYNYYQKLNQIQWVSKVSDLSNMSFWQKTNFIFEKKRKKLLVSLTKKTLPELSNKNTPTLCCNNNLSSNLISRVSLKKRSLSTLKLDAKYRAGAYSTKTVNFMNNSVSKKKNTKKKPKLKEFIKAQKFATSPNFRNGAASPITSWLSNNKKMGTKRSIVRIKRKYLLLKGFYRKYKNLKIKIQFSETNHVYSPIQIKYKKINLFFKHRPIAYYFAEMNYNSLEFTLTNDVDFLFFPYKTFFDFKLLSSMCTK